MPTIAAPLDFAKLEARQLRAHILSAAPSSPVTGQMYYNSTDNTLYWWDGTAWQAAKGGAPGGPAGGDLSGTYPNPQIAAGVIVLADCNAALIDQAAATASLRTLGTGATQACAGNDTRLSDGRAPTGAAGGDLLGSTYPNPVVAALAITDAKVAAANKDGALTTPSMRTLAIGGAGANVKAMPADARLDLIASANLTTSPVSLNSQKIVSLGAPTNDNDAATKLYVDSIAQGLDVRASVRAATTANITLSAPQTVDGISLIAGDRCLVKDQSTPATNGIYLVAAGAWTRATDQDAWTEVPSSFVFVETGTVNADTGWVCTADQGGTLGTTAITWAQFSGAGTVIAGAGMTKTGNTLDVIGTLNRILVNPDSIDIAATYVGQASITTLGTITTGVWQGTDIAVADGGTGAATAPAARTNLGAAGYYSSATHGAGTTITILASTHLLPATRGLIVQCQIEATGAVIIPDISVAANGDVTVTFSVSQSANTIRTTIHG